MLRSAEGTRVHVEGASSESVQRSCSSPFRFCRPSAPSLRSPAPTFRRGPNHRETWKELDHVADCFSELAVEKTIQGIRVHQIAGGLFRHATTFTARAAVHIVQRLAKSTASGTISRHPRSGKGVNKGPRKTGQGRDASVRCERRSACLTGRAQLYHEARDGRPLHRAETESRRRPIRS